MKKLLYIQIFISIVFVLIIVVSHTSPTPSHYPPTPFPPITCPPGMSYDEISQQCLGENTPPGNKLLYSNNKFNITFSYDPAHLLIDPNREPSSADFSIDATTNGREWRCPLPNNAVRIYSEKEISEGGIDLRNCAYIQPDIDTLASGMFDASWSKSVYGSGKNIKNLIIKGQQARLVYGSTQVRTLLVSLRTPYKDSGYLYNFLNITADSALMEDIINSLNL